MSRPLGFVRDVVRATLRQLSTVADQSERTIVLGTVLLASAVTAAAGYVLTQCYSIDVVSSFLLNPQDCWFDWGMNIGRHCFSDYAMVAGVGIQPNPWEYPLSMPPDYHLGYLAYPAAGWIPHMLFGLPAHWLGAPRLGLIGYLVALTIAVISPAAWAARGARGLERVVVFVTLSAAAIPVWAVIDRGNSVGFVVPIALVYFVALRRQRWGLVTIMAILAALVKPQFAVLAVVLFAARQWRLGGLAVVSVAASNIAAFLLWPKDFPKTITESIDNIVNFNSWSGAAADPRNVSFSRALLLIPDNIKAFQTGAGKLPNGFLAGPRSMIGYALLALVVICVLALGRRIPPIVVGVVLLATAALFPAYTSYYYLIFALPIAALIVRDPDGPPGAGIFDHLATHDSRHRMVGICVSLAVALTIAQVPFPLPPQMIPVPIYGQFGARGVVGTTPTVLTTVTFAPFLWLLACAVIIVSYARRPVQFSAGVPTQQSANPPDAAINTSPCVSEPMT